MKKQEIKVKKKTVSRGSRAKTIEMESALGIKMFNIVRQFDMAYIKLKSQWGELDGIPEEKVMVLKDEALNAVREFSNFMSRFSEQVDFKYYPPKGLGKAYRRKQEGRRLDGYVNSSASWRLKKLADAWGLSIAGVVERLTAEADEKYSAILFPEI